MGVPPNGWFIRENRIEMDDDWGYTHLWSPPYVDPLVRNIQKALKASYQTLAS